MKCIYKDNSLLVYAEYNDRESLKAAHGRWSPSLKAWKFPFTIPAYEAIKGLPNCEISDKVKAYFDAKLADISVNVGADLESFQFKTKAYQHQKLLSQLVINKKRVFFLCSVGTGKTKAAIDAVSFLNSQGTINRVLVITPAAIMDNFANEVKAHSHYDSIVVRGSVDKRQKLLSQNAMFHIINYDILTRMQEFIVKRDPQWDMIICDEIHYCKERKSNRSKALQNICHGKYATKTTSTTADGKEYDKVKKMKVHNGIPYRVGLTGTLIANHWEDAFWPYAIVAPEIFGENYRVFQDKFLMMGGFMATNPKTGEKFPSQILGYRNQEQFQQMLALNSLKYELDDVVDLPEEVHMKRLIELGPDAQHTYDTAKDQFILLSESEAKTTHNLLEQMLRLSQITAGFVPKIIEGEAIPDCYVDISREKLDALRDVLEEIDEGAQVIIWCRFRHSIDRVEELCNELGLKSIIYDGRQKEKGIYSEYNEGKAQVWIGQIATGVGYSIPGAKYAIFYEMDYSRINHTQAKGRNRRLSGSEKGSCIYVYLLAKNTIDEAILTTLKEKDFNAADALKAVKGGK